MGRITHGQDYKYKARESMGVYVWLDGREGYKQVCVPSVSMCEPDRYFAADGKCWEFPKGDKNFLWFKLQDNKKDLFTEIMRRCKSDLDDIGIEFDRVRIPTTNKDYMNLDPKIQECFESAHNMHMTV